MRLYEAEQIGIEYFVAKTLDQGFRNVDVFRTIQKTMNTRKMVRGSHGVFRKHLTTEGYLFALDFCEDWCKLGLWGYLKKMAIEEGLN